ncbi:ABC transporter permease [Falsibacillus pallidus]|uniref:Putative spermidine/putrescine transport system permease protein n=1 Tax=Falsibacillus pallidus TaxID=493781 RepID=A0A370G1T9_9BACI|nr:ABC transporter permease subunit [Falsibacillus pallidus]RDI36926.1 putative spermidine/putrescine transport system permease protein [Falsibacillus pallidus]
MKKRKASLYLSLVPLISFIILFLFVPLISMMYSSLFKNGETNLSFSNYIEIFTNPYYYKSFENSIIISLSSSAIAMILALFTAYAITFFKKKIQDRILVMANLTSNFAGIPLSFAFIVLLGNSGVFTILAKELNIAFLQHFNLYSWTGLILIYVYFQLPLAVMLMFPAFHGIQGQWKESASLLGASPLQFWRRIGMPILLPSIAGTSSILFANAMGAYASAYALTGSTYNLATIRIGALISGDIFAQPELGSALAVLLGLILIFAMMINEWLMRKVRRDVG